MKIPKKLRTRPLAESCAINELMPWTVAVSMPVADRERFLCVDFIKNENFQQKSSWRSAPDTFRVICSKKQSDYKFVVKSDGFKRRTLRDAIYAVSSPSVVYVNISERAEEMLRRWTGAESTNHQIDNLCDWCERTRQEQIQMRRAARDEFADEDYRLCPSDIPAELEKWIVEEVLPDDTTLIYKKGNVRGFCHACGTPARTAGQRFRQYERTYCPNCGTRVTAILEGSKAFEADYVRNVAIAQKSKDGNTLFIRMWHLMRDPRADYANVAAHLEEYQRFAIRDNHVARWVSEYKEPAGIFNTVRCKHESWQRANGTQVYDAPYRLCTDNIREATTGTRLQYADIEGYVNDESRKYKNPIRLMVDFARYPVLEFIQKGGYTKLLSQWIVGIDRAERRAINKRGKSLRECFKFPPSRLKLLPPEEWDCKKLIAMQWLSRRSEQLNDEYSRLLLNEDIRLDRIELCLKYTNLKAVLKYLKQQERSGAHAPEITYADYIGECEKLGLDLEAREVLFPANLNEAHHRTSTQAMYKLNKEKAEAFERAVKKLDRLSYSKGELLIRPAHSPSELTEEGITLHHCVGGYVDRVASGETAIYFIRLVDYPNRPYYTLELKNKRVVQCHTLYNRTCMQVGEPFIQSFVDEWLSKIVNKGAKKAS